MHIPQARALAGASLAMLVPVPADGSVPVDLARHPRHTHTSHGQRHLSGRKQRHATLHWSTWWAFSSKLQRISAEEYRHRQVRCRHMTFEVNPGMPHLDLRLPDSCAVLAGCVVPVAAAGLASGCCSAVAPAATCLLLAAGGCSAFTRAACGPAGASAPPASPALRSAPRTSAGLAPVAAPAARLAAAVLVWAEPASLPAASAAASGVAGVAAAVAAGSCFSRSFSGKASAILCT